MAREPRREHATGTESEIEPRAHGTIALSGAQVGTSVDTNGSITEIRFTGAPTSYEVPTFDPATGLPLTGYFCLIDKPAGGVTRVLYNYNGHVNIGNSPHPTHKVMTGNVIPFTNLVLQSCPAGATYTVITA